VYFDSLTLAAVADELAALCLGGRVQRVVQTGALGIGLEIYRSGRRHQLVLSAHPSYARAHLAAEKLSRGIDQPTPLLLLLRKYVLGGRLSGVEQPALERILVLRITKEPSARNAALEAAEPAGMADELMAENGEARHCELIAELMDRRSNVMLVSDENLVLGSVKRVTAAMSSRRIEPGQPYSLPPRQNKLDPRSATAQALRQAAQASERTLAQVIVGGFRGVAPQAAREAIFRATGSADLPANAELPWQQLAEELAALFEAGQRRPTLVRRDGRIVAFAPYEPRHLAQGAELVAAESMSAALEAFYTPLEGLTAHRQRRERLEAALREARARLERQRANLQAELARAGDLERLRWEGEMIFALLHTLEPHQSELLVEGQTIRLDPGLSAVENAQARFRAYDKAKGALAGVPERLAATERQLAALDELLVLVGLADSYEQLALLTSEAEAGGYLRAERRQGKRLKRPARTAPLTLRSSDGLTIFVGRSATQNVEVTFRLGRGDDLWLHTRQIPGAHVLVRRAGGEVPERSILEAAAYAAYYSGARDEPAVDVDVCRRSLVRRIKDGPPGLVSYQAERTLRVAPRRPAASEPLFGAQKGEGASGAEQHHDEQRGEKPGAVGEGQGNIHAKKGRDQQQRQQD
jgi:predicted ribosome quality control (RQC) complex YloA/Tae2 family protein